MQTFDLVKVKDDGPEGYMLINAHEFDANVHEMYEPEAPAPTTAKQRVKAKAAKAAAETSTPAPE